MAFSSGTVICHSIFWIWADSHSKSQQYLIEEYACTVHKWPANLACHIGNLNPGGWQSTFQTGLSHRVPPLHSHKGDIKLSNAKQYFEIHHISLL